MFSCGSVFGLVLLCCFAEKAFCSSVLWPAGQYGLPMPRSNCPGAIGFSWKKGQIYQDLENGGDRSTISPQSHLHAQLVSNDVMEFFCIKTDNTTALDSNRKPWPKGQYCIYRKGSGCPAGMLSGSVLWDDENGVSGKNTNWHYGELPDGVYNRDTKIFFCCHVSGSYHNPVELPIDKPFYLIAFTTHCQEVLNAGHTMEYITYDTENDNNHNQRTFPYPYGAEFPNPRIHYCYYQACSWTLTALQGTFSSPYYPQNYNNKASCKWRINVPQNYTISLTFEDFALQSRCCKCDYVEVWEAHKNDSMASIGKFCDDTKPDPSQPIRSTSNNMIVMFYSDDNVTSTGFNASYQVISAQAEVKTTPISALAIKRSGTRTTTIPPQTATLKVTSSIQATSEETRTPTRRPQSTADTETTTNASTEPSTSTAEAKTVPTRELPSTADTETTTNESTEPGTSTAATEIEGVHDVQRKGRVEGVNVIYVIAGLAATLIIKGGAIVAALFYFRRNRDRSHSEEEGLAVTFSNGKNAVTPDRNRKCGTNNNEHYSEITKPDKRYTSSGVDDFNAYEEVKDRVNPLYNSSDVPNAYEELKENDNPLYNGSAGTENTKKNNDPVYDRISVWMPHSKLNN